MLNYNYLRKMTDADGILQFSHYDKPDVKSGYTLDDNARALMVAIFAGSEAESLARAYVNYMIKAQRPNGSWANIFQNGQYSSRFDSEDSIGRAILACSIGVSSPNYEINNSCHTMLRKYILPAMNFTFPRGIAYTLLGLCKSKIEFFPEKTHHAMINRLVNALISLYQKNSSGKWHWFEKELTYCNAIMPQALFAAYAITGDKKTLKVAYESLAFLNDILFREGYLNIIGNKGWLQKDGPLPRFDQQPVDACSIAFACSEAFAVLGKKEYQEFTLLANQWFYGKNVHGISLYDAQSGGCYDALTAEGVNLNQGAESLLSLLLTKQLVTGRLHKEIEYSQYSG
jgi:hypothetical protein